MIIKFIITGYFILITAILANTIAEYLNIDTWYKFIEGIVTNGLYDTVLLKNFLDIIWLIIIYPIILTFGYIIGDQIYSFLIS